MLGLTTIAAASDGITRLDAFVFHFDLIGFVDDYLARRQSTLERLRRFQCEACAAFPLGHEHTYVITLFDNVWARVNAHDPGQPSLLLKAAGDVMRAAE